MLFETKIPTVTVRILSDFFLCYPVRRYAHEKQERLTFYRKPLFLK
jgi:hypothetical protein